MTSNGSRFQDARKSTHFYRIILERTIPQKKLGIPSKFAKNYGDRLSSPVILKVPTGASWQVELSKNGDEIWLERGWQEFSVYHNLKHGHFLVFQYEGDNHFHVLIFDMSAVEILYKYNETEDHISCQISDDLTSADDDVEEIEDSHCSTQESQGELKDTTDENSWGKEARRASCSNTCANLEAANTFISNYPHFKIVLKHRYHVNVPFSFVRGNMKCKSQTVMLQVAGKSWQVKLNVHSDKRFALLTAGWSAFASENSLQPGDVCMFELIKNNVLNASIFKYGG